MGVMLCMGKDMGMMDELVREKVVRKEMGMKKSYVSVKDGKVVSLAMGTFESSKEQEWVSGRRGVAICIEWWRGMMVI